MLVVVIQSVSLRGVDLPYLVLITTVESINEMNTFCIVDDSLLAKD
jgi:hypothetical protein